MFKPFTLVLACCVFGSANALAASSCTDGANKLPKPACDLVTYAKNGEVAPLQQALKAGADVKTLDIRGNTLLILTMTALLEQVAERDKATPATRKLADDFVKDLLVVAVVLIDAGVDVNSGDAKYGLTPLHLSVAKPVFDDLTRRMLAKGANVEAVGGDHGVSPLQQAILADNARAVETLLQAGADPKRTKPGLERPDVVAQKASPAIAALFKKYER